MDIPDRPAEPALELERFLPYRLSVVANLVSKAFARRYGDAFGLSIPEWRVMAVLGRYAPASSQEVCERTAMDKVKVSRAVARLVSAGLVARRDNPQDQRLNSLTLSRRGRSVYQDIVPLARAMERDLLDGLSAEESAQLHALLGKLQARVAHLAANGGGPDPVEGTD